MTLRVVPEGLAAASAAVESITARLAAAHAGAAPAITAVVPSAADPVSLQTAAGFLEAGAAALGVGADLVNLQAIADGKPEVITNTARGYLEVIARTRAPKA